MRSWVCAPRPRRMDSEATKRPAACERLKGVMWNLPTVKGKDELADMASIKSLGTGDAAQVQMHKLPGQGCRARGACQGKSVTTVNVHKRWTVGQVCGVGVPLPRSDLLHPR